MGTAATTLPAPFVAGFLDRDDVTVRGAASDPAPGANPPAPLLREGLSDHRLRSTRNDRERGLTNDDREPAIWFGPGGR